MFDYLIDCFIGLLTIIGYILLGLVILAAIGMIAAIVMAFVEDRKDKKNKPCIRSNTRHERR